MHVPDERRVNSACRVRIGVSNGADPGWAMRTMVSVDPTLQAALAAVIGLESGWPLAALGAVIGQLLTTPFVAAATTLLYLDLRIRTEGLDIELAARRAIDRVA